MPTLTETEARLRRTLGVVALSVRDSDEAKLPHSSSMASVKIRPLRRSDPTVGRRNRVLVFAVSFVAVLGVGAFSMWIIGTASDGDRVAPAATSPDTPQVSQPETPADLNGEGPGDTESMPAYVLEHPLFSFVGGELTEDEYGAVLELQWENDGRSLEVTVFAPESLGHLEGQIQEYLAEAELVEEIVRGTFTITHIRDDAADADIYLWTEANATVRVRGFGLGANAEEIFDSLIRYETNSDQIQQLLTSAYALFDNAETEKGARDANSFEALYQKTLRGNGPESAPESITSAVGDQLEEQLASSNMILVSASVDQTDGIRFEEATYSDGSNWITLSWQNWPQNVDTGVLYPDDAEVEELGRLDLIIRLDPHPEGGMSSVAAFDGSILAQVTVGGTGFSLNEIKELAVNLYRSLTQAEQS